MEAVKSLNATIIIISDANSVFIDHILSTRKLTHLVGRNKEGSHFQVRENLLHFHQPHPHREEARPSGRQETKKVVLRNKDHNLRLANIFDLRSTAAKKLLKDPRHNLADFYYTLQDRYSFNINNEIMIGRMPLSSQRNCDVKLGIGSFLQVFLGQN